MKISELANIINATISGNHDLEIKGLGKIDHLLQMRLLLSQILYMPNILLIRKPEQLLYPMILNHPYKGMI